MESSSKSKGASWSGFRELMVRLSGVCYEGQKDTFSFLGKVGRTVGYVTNTRASENQGRAQDAVKKWNAVMGGAPVPPKLQDLADREGFLLEDAEVRMMKCQVTERVVKWIRDPSSNEAGEPASLFKDLLAKLDTVNYGLTENQLTGSSSWKRSLGYIPDERAKSNSTMAQKAVAAWKEAMKGAAVPTLLANLAKGPGFMLEQWQVNGIVDSIKERIEGLLNEDKIWELEPVSESNADVVIKAAEEKGMTVGELLNAINGKSEQSTTSMSATVPSSAPPPPPPPPPAGGPPPPPPGKSAANSKKKAAMGLGQLLQGRRKGLKDAKVRKLGPKKQGEEGKAQFVIDANMLQNIALKPTQGSGGSQEAKPKTVPNAAEFLRVKLKPTKINAHKSNAKNGGADRAAKGVFGAAAGDAFMKKARALRQANDGSSLEEEQSWSESGSVEEPKKSPSANSNTAGVLAADPDDAEESE